MLENLTFSFFSQDVWGKNCGPHGSQPEVGSVRTGRHLQWRWWSFFYSDPEVVKNKKKKKIEEPSFSLVLSLLHCVVTGGLFQMV